MESKNPSVQDLDRQIRQLQEKRKAALEAAQVEAKQSIANIWTQLKTEIDALRQHEGYAEFSINDIDPSAGAYLTAGSPAAKARRTARTAAAEPAASGMPEFSGDPRALVSYMKKNDITSKAKAKNARAIGAGVGAKVAKVLNQLAEEKQIRDNGETGSRRQFWVPR